MCVCEESIRRRAGLALGYHANEKKSKVEARRSRALLVTEFEWILRDEEREKTEKRKKTNEVRSFKKNA